VLSVLPFLGLLARASCPHTAAAAFRFADVLPPPATTCLRTGKDCENITNFFFKKGVGAVMTLRELFDFVTDEAITVENFEDYLDKMMHVCQSRPAPTAKESECLSGWIA
jgi:hypothetical protein